MYCSFYLLLSTTNLPMVLLQFNIWCISWKTTACHDDIKSKKNWGNPLWLLAIITFSAMVREIGLIIFPLHCQIIPGICGMQQYIWKNYGFCSYQPSIIYWPYLSLFVVRFLSCVSDITSYHLFCRAHHIFSASISWRQPLLIFYSSSFNLRWAHLHV